MDLLIILFVIFLNGIFAMAEIAMVSSRKSKLQQMALEGNLNAQTAFELSQKPGNFFSVIQIGITFIGILTGAIGEGSLIQKLSAFMQPFPVIGAFHSQIAFIFGIALITYLSIVIGELIPKQIALSNPERITVLLSPFMSLLSNVAYPLVRFLTSSTEAALKMLRLKPKKEQPITEEEIRTFIREGTKIGIFNRTEKELVERALLLDDLRVNMLMMPRNRIVWFDLEKFIENYRQYLADYKHSRILFCKDTLDKVVGVIHMTDFLNHYIQNKHANIKKNLVKPLFISENMHALKVLEMFRHSPVHIALVLDEFGSVRGLVTLNDVLEALVGDIKTQNFTDDSHIVKRADGSLLVDGISPIDKIKKILELEFLPKEQLGLYQTIGGFVINYLDRIPKTGDKFELEGYIFEVADMDSNRVDEVLITKIKNYQPKQEIAK